MKFNEPLDLNSHCCFLLQFFETKFIRPGARGYTINFLFPFGPYTNKSVGFPTRELAATCDCPCEDSPNPIHTLAPIVLVLYWWSSQNAGKCKRLNTNICTSVGIIEIRGVSTLSPLNFRFKIVAPMALFTVFLQKERCDVAVDWCFGKEWQACQFLMSLHLVFRLECSNC